MKFLLYSGIEKWCLCVWAHVFLPPECGGRNCEMGILRSLIYSRYHLFPSPYSLLSVPFQIKSSPLVWAFSTLGIQKGWKATPPSYEYATARGGEEAGEKTQQDIPREPACSGLWPAAPTLPRVLPKPTNNSARSPRPGSSAAAQNKGLELFLAREMWPLNSPAEPRG